MRLEEIKQNPFRETLLDNMPDSGLAGDHSDQRRQSPSSSGDVSEDMSWGFDQTFFQKDGAADSDGDEDYDDI